MAKIVKKKKKKLGSRGRGAASREQSPLRPYYVPKLAPCSNCPAGNNVREVMRIINNYDWKNRSEDDTWKEAFQEFAKTTPLLSTCGRVCPAICEQNCNRKDVDEKPVHIRCIERYVGDYALEHDLKVDISDVEKQKEKVAIIGGGPAGLSCAYSLARLGYSATIYEAFEKAGGMLRYGIPDYRLPQEILDGEIKRVTDLGVELKCGVTAGKDISYEEMRSEYDALFVGIGAHKGYKLRVDGEDAINVMTGTGFLNLIHKGAEIDVGDKVLVIGGGDTAIDAARICRRLGADVTIVYRRTVKEMPAIEPEIEEAQKEGVKIDFLAAPVEIFNDGERATGMKCIRMELGEPDDSGRRRPVPIEGSEFDMDATFIIPAISQQPDFDPLENVREGRNWVQVDENGKITTIDDHLAYGGGDVTNLALVTDAIGQGRCAAEAMHRTFRSLDKEEAPTLDGVDADKLFAGHWLEQKQETVAERMIAIEEALAELTRETTNTFTVDEAKTEAARCMSCGKCFDCENCFKYCQDSAIIRPVDKGGDYRIKMEVCIGCDKCVGACPCGLIDMKMPTG